MELVFDRINIPPRHSFIARVQSHPDRTPRIHSHRNFEINYVLRGSGRRIVGSDISNFEPGDLVLLGPNLPHCWDGRGGGSATKPVSVVIHFNEHLLDSDFLNAPELLPVRKLLKRADAGIWFRGPNVGRIGRLLRQLVELNGLESYIELLKVFHLLLQEDRVEYLSEIAYAPDFDKDLEKINLVYEYVFEHIQNGIRQEEVAALLHMTPGSFCRYFKKKTKRSFMDYVRRVRIGLAAKMLTETDKRISQVCYESGYNNIANFNYHFKSILHKTPTEYRRAFRNLA